MLNNTNDDEQAIMMNFPTVYANKLFATFSTDGFKFGFGEQSTDGKHLQPRASIFVSREGVVQLQELCTIILEKADELAKQMKEQVN